jgi:glucose 1-dehydrogenase
VEAGSRNVSNEMIAGMARIGDGRQTLRSCGWPFPASAANHEAFTMTDPVLPRRLVDRVALVTGASRGIGRAVALRLALEGARVAIAHRDDADGIAETLDDFAQAGLAVPQVVQADMADDAAVTAMVADVITRQGRLDILVNNAGMQAETPGASFDADLFRRILDVNLTGAAIASREAIAHFRTRTGGGTIINTSSVHEIIPKPGYLAYAASKAALAHVTRTLALEHAAEAIRVNAVAPGAVITDINASWIHDPVKKAEVEAHIPMGFAATPEMMAPLFAFLASDDALYVTGQTLVACGGLTLYGDFARNWSS